MRDGNTPDAPGGPVAEVAGAAELHFWRPGAQDAE
ncbi:hypothetical protein BDK92_1771 [Micromonospora pisi]|uniref:Uncharacterized protein n=1 Tax=Micromonospora pisi TaxID=589240 RepID=A0A495JF47_9ACTN|nr:hypothetical protein BDK92_1771 [Micromonospora pisi]